jgi:uncharacterized membrane protein
MIVHFPIALVLVAFLSELIGHIFKKQFFLQASVYLVVLAGLGALAAYLTGDAAGDGMEGGSLQRALEDHEVSAILTLWLTIAAAGAKIVLYFVKKEMRWLKILAFTLLFAAAGSVARTGYLGGQLVFKHAAGVELGIGNFGTLQGNEDGD